MIGVHIDKIKVVQKSFDIEIKTQQKKALSKLRVIDRSLFNNDELGYLDEVTSCFEIEGFLLKEPHDLVHLKTHPGKVPDNSRRGPDGKTLKGLKQFIIEALNYKSLRDSFYPKYFEKIGIKACVYCNSQLTITVKRQGQIIGARFDVDHYNCKDDYPFLCISLFNLYPACSSCNRVKSTNVVSLNLYTNIPSQLRKSVFSFKLDPYAKSKYLLTKDPKDITFKFIEPPLVPSAMSFQEVFSIEQIYATQKDVIQELIIKSQIYNYTYKEELRKNFSKLSLHKRLFERVIVGNYTDDTEIHKRPMSKMMMDIARDLRLLTD